MGIKAILIITYFFRLSFQGNDGELKNDERFMLLETIEYGNFFFINKRI